MTQCYFYTKSEFCAQSQPTTTDDVKQSWRVITCHFYLSCLSASFILKNLNRCYMWFFGPAWPCSPAEVGSRPLTKLLFVTSWHVIRFFLVTETVVYSETVGGFYCVFHCNELNTGSIWSYVQQQQHSYYLKTSYPKKTPTFFILFCIHWVL